MSTPTLINTSLKYSVSPTPKLFQTPQKNTLRPQGSATPTLSEYIPNRYPSAYKPIANQLHLSVPNVTPSELALSSQHSCVPTSLCRLFQTVFQLRNLPSSCLQLENTSICVSQNAYCNHRSYGLLITPMCSYVVINNQLSKRCPAASLVPHSYSKKAGAPRVVTFLLAEAPRWSS